MRLTTPLAFLFLVAAGINAEPMFPGNNLDLKLQSKKIILFLCDEGIHTLGNSHAQQG
jgi:hypothetical protein